MKVGKTFQPGLLSTCEGGFQGTLMVLLDTMGRFYNRNSLTPRHLKNLLTMHRITRRTAQKVHLPR